MKLGKKLGVGMTAEVFVINEERVVKLFHEKIPKDWIHYEFKLAHRVGEVFENAPMAYEIIELEERLGIVYERAYGRELSDLLEEDVTRAKEFGIALAELHIHMHEITARDLPLQKDRFKHAIKDVSDLLGGRTEKLLEKLGTITFEDKICHGDLHLGNVMLQDDKYRVIDWMTASSGTPIADVCRSIIMLDTPYVLEKVSEDLKPMVVQVLKEVKTAYLEVYFKYSKYAYEELDQWMAIVAAARISENIPKEKEWLLEIVDRYI